MLGLKQVILYHLFSAYNIYVYNYMNDYKP